MAWHESYRTRVLERGYRFAETHLHHYFLDALTAHLDTVGKLPTFASAEAQADIAALRTSLIALHDVTFPPQAPDVPDYFFAIQAELERRHGDMAGIGRTGLSRNDLDMAVYKLAARDQLLATGADILTLRDHILTLAERHTETVLIAYTHHQPGQPISVAHYLVAVLHLLERTTERLLQAFDRLNTSALGAAALAGSSHPLDRAFTAGQLGFDGPVLNTYEAVSASDWQYDVIAVSDALALDLSRFVTDLILWSERGWFRLSDELVQGSSIMPQKRNPVTLEHARTAFSRALGYTGVVRISSHNIPLGDLNDFGPDLQEALVLQRTEINAALTLLTAACELGDFCGESLAQAAQETDTTATELADVLVRDFALPFPEAHRIVAALVARQQDAGERFLQLTPSDVAAVGGPKFTAEELRDAIDPTAFITRRDGIGGPAPHAVTMQLKDAKMTLQRDTLKVHEKRDSVANAIQTLRNPRSEGRK